MREREGGCDSMFMLYLSLMLLIANPGLLPPKCACDQYFYFKFNIVSEISGVVSMVMTP